MRKTIFVSAVTLIMCIAPFDEGMAGGFYVSEAMGTASASNTTTHGVESSFTNPAGMTGVDGDAVIANMIILIPQMEFDVDLATGGGDDGGNSGIVSPIPSAHYVKKLSDRARFGFSMTAPLGGGVDYGNNFVGRYSANKATLAGLGISPSFGYRVNDSFSVGAGITLIYTRFEEEISILQGAGVPDAEVSFDKVDGWGWQGFLGLNYQATDRTRLGLVYRSDSETDISGDVDFNGLIIPFVPVTEIEIEWTNPQLLELGMHYQVNDELSLVASVDWEDWSAFSENQLTVAGGALGTSAATLDRNWQDTYSGAIGFIYQRSGHGFSAGVSYDSSAVDDEDRTFDLPVDEQILLSASYSRNTGGRLSYGIGATLMNAGDNAIDQTSQGVRVKGDFDKNWLLFVGAHLRYEF